jgi:hypothetical protein
MTHTRLAVLLLAVVACGCYEASAPLGPPGAVVVDPAIVGTWRCGPPQEEKSTERATLVVMPFDESQYFAEWTSEGDAPDRYRVYGTRAGREVVLNVHQVPANEGGWAFFRYRVDPAGVLRLSMVKDEAMKGLSESAALDAIRARAGDEAIYMAVADCTRVKRSG